jgi:hypothetical protein
MYLAQSETHEKVLARVSLGLKGVFIPCSKVRLSNASVFWRSHLIECFGFRANTWSTFVPSFVYRWRFSSRLVEGLCLWYLVTLFSFRKQLQVWYVFETVAAELEFIKSTKHENSRDDAYFGWCDSLSEPVALVYVKRSSSDLSTALLQALLFLRMCYSMLEQQQRLYDWIDPDEFMNVKNKETCPYFDIHKNRNRIFSEAMLYDWLACNFLYPIFITILTVPELSGLRKKLGNAHLDKAKRAVECIHRKQVTGL